MQMTLEKVSKVAIIRKFSGLTLNNIFENKYPSLVTLKKQYSLEKLEKVMSILLHDLSLSFNGELTKEDVEEVCAEINSSSLKNLTLEDIYLVCRNIKLSNNYGKLNVNKIMTELIKHQDNRFKAAEHYSYNKHLENKFVDNDRKPKKEVERIKFREAQSWYLQQNTATTNNTK